MERLWLKTFERHFPDRVVDALEGTGMAQSGRDLGFTLHIVRGAASSDVTTSWIPGLDRMLADIVQNIGETKTRVGSCDPGFHEAVQSVYGMCCCWYKYAGNRHHPHFHLPEDGKCTFPRSDYGPEYVGILKTVGEWLHNFKEIQDAGSAAKMNQCVGNRYTYRKD